MPSVGSEGFIILTETDKLLQREPITASERELPERLPNRCSCRLLSGFRIWVLGNGQLLSPKLGKWAGTAVTHFLLPHMETTRCVYPLLRNFTHALPSG
ncbi:Very-long-chain 3-oxoacyl-CoA reductase-A [Liparis tanakae]|uniref:Very-long-chain 3-oxoacyl-CoA reductase-A n=1 Tax=Liparis tanakae TaxID=230148 RepID=A0A4Z2EL26_9TELE|nr:Very-long-chain 3-oxoacyl-CoA reductase-A [Liparis tanakae]